MRVSQDWLQARLAQNPSLKVTVQGGKSANLLTAQAMAVSTTNATSNNKFFNRKVFVYEDGFVSEDKKADGHGAIKEKYDSVKEFRRWKALQLLERSQQIRELKRQVVLEIQPSFEYQETRIQAINYIADFFYVDKDGCITIEDVKAYDENRGCYRTTKDFDLKWKLLKFRYPMYNFIIT